MPSTCLKIVHIFATNLVNLANKKQKSAILIIILETRTSKPY